MSYFRFIPAAMITAAALFVTAPSHGAPVTLATLDIDGEYSISTPQGETSVFSIAGSFAANLIEPFPSGVQDYTLTASFALGGVELFAGGLPASFDMADALAVVTPAIAFLINNAGNIYSIGGVDISWGGGLVSQTATSISGFYSIAIETIEPINSYQIGAFFAGALAGTPLDGLIPASFTLPANDSGYFEIALAIKTETPAPIPLPAAGWLMFAGLGGLGLVAHRRRKAA